MPEPMAAHSSSPCEAVQSAGGWRDYIASLRLPYCLIRHEVSETRLVCPVSPRLVGQQGLTSLRSSGASSVFVW